MQPWTPMNVLLYMTGGCELKGLKEDVSYLPFFSLFYSFSTSLPNLILTRWKEPPVLVSAPGLPSRTKTFPLHWETEATWRSTASNHTPQDLKHGLLSVKSHLPTSMTAETRSR